MSVETVETRYVFTFADGDGVTYQRHVYWETLYALLVPPRQVLAARRAVPINDMMFAFYASLREARRKNSEPALLPEPEAGQALDELPTQSEAELVPYAYSDVLALALREEANLPDMPVRQLSARYSSIVPMARVPEEFETYTAAPFVGVGRPHPSLPPVPVVPPVLKDFVHSRYERLGQIVSRYEDEEELDGRFHSERMSSLVGRAEANALGTALHFEIVLLGSLAKGSLPANQKDPEASGHSYQVDPEADLSDVVLKEVAGRLARSRLGLLTRWVLHGDTRRVRFAGEL